MQGNDETVLAIGLMSGTSADGVDAALVEIRREPRTATLRHYREAPYPDDLRKKVLSAASGDCTTSELCLLHAELGQAFAVAARKLMVDANILPGAVSVIGSHGQTVWHAPSATPPATLQLGNPAIIARVTGLPVVSDFRSADLAVGGQGAPLVPMIHHVLFSNPGHDRAVVNLGGIANLTWLPGGADTEAVTAFDTGPANMVMDGLVERLSGGAERMDKNGARARKGNVSGTLLTEFLDDPYFSQPPPKSTGRERFGAAYVEEFYQRGKALKLSDNDMVTTATALTARTVSRAIQAQGTPAEVLLCGGGAKNPALVLMLIEELPGTAVALADARGVSSQALEAMAFAELACRHMWKEPGNVPSATGANRPVVLGTLTPA